VRATFRRQTRHIGATLALVGFNLALQPTPRPAYDTDRHSTFSSHECALMDNGRAGSDASGAHPDLESTRDLVQQAKSGDRDALDRLLARVLPPLRRWAGGRLPRSRRDLMDTDDLVQETAIRAVRRLDAFEPRHEGSLQAYLRQAVMNRIRDEIRHSARIPATVELDENERNRDASPLEAAIGREAADLYDAALSRLRAEDRDAIVARLEMDLSYEEVAQAVGKPSAGAARVAISRALVRLAEEMNRGS
jgi:RNA polymerase sigma-70 factor (ECF subfamily)